MIFAPAHVYCTEHRFNQEVSALLAAGFRADRQPASIKSGFAARPEPGLSIVYGIMRGTGEIIQQCEGAGLDYLYCDHSYFDRCRVDYSKERWEGYYRLVPNHRYFQRSADMPSDRWDKLGIELKPWRKGGSHVVVIPITKWVGAFYGIDPEAWLRRTIATLRQHTDRDIVVKQKDLGQLSSALEGAWALVTFASNAAIEAVIQGIPIFTAAVAAAAPMANQRIEEIETPATCGMAERERHLSNLAYQQFTPQEIADGAARAILMEQFGTPPAPTIPHSASRSGSLGGGNGPA